MSKQRFNIVTLFILSLLLVSGCSKKSNNTVLQINNFTLSTEAFSKSYYVAPSILKFGLNPKQTYANAIINDYLVSNYLINKGFGKDSSLAKTLRLFRQELLVEKVFKEDVDKKIIITKDEIRKEILKGNKQVKVKYIFAKDLKEAEELKAELNTGVSFDELQKNKLLNLGLTTDAGETGFINYGEVDEKINKVIFSLPANEISDIVETSAGYFILKIVDIRRTILSESDIARLSPTYKKILYNKKLYAESRSYLKKFLDPKEIVVNGKVFKKFVNALYPIYKRKRKTKTITLNNEQEFFKVDDYTISDELLNEELVKYNGGGFTVADILYHLSYYPVSFPTTSIKDFAGALKSKVGLRLRDIFLEQEGLKRGYENNNVIKEEIFLWKNQIITYRYLQKLTEEIEVDTNEVKKIYEEKVAGNVSFKTARQKLISSYKDYLIYKKLKNIVEEENTKTDVKINTKNLEEINLPTATNNFGVDLYSYKMGLPYSRLAFAIPNRIWAAENIWNTIISN